LAAAHRVGIVHRDLKPDNIMLTPEGQVKVLDLGIAHTESEEQAGTSEEVREEGRSSSGSSGDPELDSTVVLDRFPDLVSPTEGPTEAPSVTAAGTISYMSPEQARREPLTIASDVYSLGLVLQELFTGQRAVPKKLPRAEIEERVQRGATEPVEGLEPRLRQLIEELKAPAPEDRPTAQEALEGLRDIAAGPERRRRRRFRLIAGFAMAALLLAALASIVVTRIQDRRQAEIAQRFTQEAAELEAMLRREYLAPVHDIRPAQRQVRQGMKQLQEEMRGLAAIGEGPGRYALGRLALALEDFETARHNFQEAWDSGYQGPEVASGLALATFEAYRRRVPRVQALANKAQREKEWERLRLDLGEPSFAFMDQEEFEERRSRFSGPADSSDYLKALRAFHGQDYDEALRRSTAATQADPLFYEAELLTAKIHRARMEEAHLRAEGEETITAYGLAREALTRASEVGRSDPAVYQETCEVDLLASLSDLYYGSGDQFESTLSLGFEACATVLRIVPDHVEARIASADLYLRSAEAEGQSEGALQSLRKGRAVIEEALKLDPQSGRAWKIAGHVAMVEADWYVFQSRLPEGSVEELAERARNAYQHAVRYQPEAATIHNSLGNVHGLLAAYRLDRGEDPRPSLEASIKAYREALELDANYAGAYGNLVLAYDHHAEYLALTGQDPAEVVKAGEAVFEACRDRGFEVQRLYSAMAELLLREARYRDDQGGNPLPFVRRARRLIDRGLALPGSSYYLIRAHARSWLREAEYRLDTGQDPEPSLERIRTIAADQSFREADPGWVAMLSGAAARIAAEEGLVRGKAPKDFVERALQELRRSLDLGNADAEALLERGKTYLLQARIRLDQGKDPYASLAQATEDFARGAQLRPLEAEFPLRSAEAALLSAQTARRRGSDFAADIDLAKEFLDRVEEMRPNLAEAEILHREVSALVSKSS